PFPKVHWECLSKAHLRQTVKTPYEAVLLFFRLYNSCKLRRHYSSFFIILIVSVSFVTMTANARRLCEVFCILQNLQMYEVPERASDGKASGRCDGSPKGFRHIALAALRSLSVLRLRQTNFAKLPVVR